MLLPMMATSWVESMRRSYFLFSVLAPLIVSFSDSNPLSSSIRCDDFDTQEQAQTAFENGKTGLDGDNDGIACERLK